LEVLSDTPVPPEKKSFEAGRLHFIDFSETPLGKIIFSVFRNDFKTMMTKSQYITQHVFKGLEFKPLETGPKEVKIVMTNADYSIEHFRGLFQAWMDFSGEKGIVEAREIESKEYEYTMKWQ